MIKTVLRGLGQIMLQESAITGAFFLAGIAYASPPMGLAAVVSSLAGALTAKALKFPDMNIQKGLYGFSPALVGVAMLLFFKSSFVVWLLILVGSALAAMLQHLFMAKKIPVFTLPFVLITWMLWFVFTWSFPLPRAASDSIIRPLNWEFSVLGYGQVIFQGSVVSGVLFFLGVLLKHGRSAVFGLLGSILGDTFAWALNLPFNDIAIGLFSFNGVLCAIAFTGKSPKNTLLAFMSVILTIPLSLLFFNYEIPQLTFPFVISTMLCLGIKKLAERISSSAARE